MFVAFEEPRPCAMFAFGIAPWRPVTSVAPMRSRPFSVKAETEAGTFC
jgi:hypothetical protein